MRLLPALLLALLAAAAAAAAAPPPNPACDVCKWAGSSAQDALADPDAQRAVMRFLEETACAAVPGGGADQCRELAREYVPSAIAALESFTPGEACATVGACPPEEAGIAAAAGAGGAPRPLAGLPCPVCRLTLNNVKLQLEDPANQAALVDKARLVGGGAEGGGARKNGRRGTPTRARAAPPSPPRSASPCRTRRRARARPGSRPTVSRGGVVGWRAGSRVGGERVGAHLSSSLPPPAAKVFAVVDDFDPNRLCTVVGACPPMAALAGAGGDAGALGSALAAAAARPPAPRATAPDTCDTCKSIMASLQAALADEEKDAAAVEKVKRVCDAFHAFRAQCLAAIDADAGPVLDWLRANVAPEACGKLGLCPPAEAEGGAPWGAARVDVA